MAFQEIFHELFEARVLLLKGDLRGSDDKIADCAQVPGSVVSELLGQGLVVVDKEVEYRVGIGLEHILQVLDALQPWFPLDSVVLLQNLRNLLYFHFLFILFLF